jgi:hypothetical protein
MYKGEVVRKWGWAVWLLFPWVTHGGELPPRPAQLTLSNKTADSVTLAWAPATNDVWGNAYEVFVNNASVGLSTSNSFLCTGLTQGRPYVFRVRARDKSGQVSAKSNAVLTTPQGGGQRVEPLKVRTQFHALVLNYDPHIWADNSYVRASEYYRFRDVSTLVAQYMELLKRASGGQTVWSVAGRFDLDEFAPPVVQGKAVFDATNYVALRAQGYNYDVSYDALIHDLRFGIVEQVNSGKVDGIWVFGMPNINLWETAMAGPNPYWVNGSPIVDSSLTRNIVIYGFGKDPHQGVGFMCENTCHMAENILGRISADWPLTVPTRVFQTLNLDNPARSLTETVVNDWTHFIQAEAASWDAALVAPGNAQAGLSHFPPTALYNYDWSTLNLDFSGLGPFQAIDGDWSIVDGECRVVSANSAKAVALDGMTLSDNLGSYHPPEAFSDGDVEFTVRTMNDSYPSYAGLLFRVSACKPGPNQASGYFVGLNAWDNQVVVAKLQNQFIALTNAPYDVRTNFRHRLRVETRGPSIKVFLDGVLTPLISIADHAYQTGGFGLSSYFTDAFFDDVSVVPHVSSAADKWYRYPASAGPVRDLTPMEWNGEGTPAMDGFYAWWWEHVPKNGGAHSATNLPNGASAILLNTWWPYVFDINCFTSTVPAADIVFAPEDVTPPASPRDAAGLALGGSKLGLSWGEPADDVGVTRYEIFRDGVLLRKTPVNYLIDSRLTPGTRYRYAIQACDGSDNTSAPVELEMSTLASDPAGVVLNGSFEFLPQLSGWETDAFGASNAQFAWEPPGSGRNGGRCVSIDASHFNDASWTQTVTGLTPGETYWATGWIRGQDIIREPGRMTAANLCLEGTWTHAPDYLDGTFDWQQASFSFVAPPSGTVRLGCRLGYWSNTTRGKVWFDDIRIVQPKELRFESARLDTPAWLHLVLQTPPGNRYRLEKSLDLQNWTEIQSFEAAHPISETQDRIGPESRCFYRAVRTNGF